MNMRAISLVGLGRLGLCLAAIYASKGFRVIGVDLLSSITDAVNRGLSPIIEPGVDALLAEVGGKSFVGTQSYEKAIAESDISIILTGTPSLADGSFSNAQVEGALEELAAALKSSRKPYHLFVISSTVVPGSAKDCFIPIIERHSGRKFNDGFGICYNPGFISLGSVLNDFMNPEVVVIGQGREEDGLVLAQLHASICENSPVVCRMSIDSAEIAKLCLNAYITMKLSFANLLGNICGKVENADMDAVSAAIGSDRRVSPFYFKPGLAYGGTCFPRDTRALLSVLRKLELPLELMQACEAINNYQDTELSQRVLRAAKQQKAASVGILGLAFKPNTPVIVESPAIKLAESLLSAGLRVIGYDPLAMKDTRARFGERLTLAANVAECLDSAPVCVLTQPSGELAEAVYAYAGTERKYLVDCWRILDADRLPEAIVTV